MEALINAVRDLILRNTIIACKIANNTSNLIQEKIVNFCEMNSLKSTQIVVTVNNYS